MLCIPYWEMGHWQFWPVLAQIDLRYNMVVHSCLGGAVVGRRTRDRKVASLTPGRDAIKSTRSTQPSIPMG